MADYTPNTETVADVYATATGLPEAPKRRQWFNRWYDTEIQAAEQRGAYEATVEAARILREIAPESDTPLKNMPGNIPVYIWLAHRAERYGADQYRKEGDE